MLFKSICASISSERAFMKSEDALDDSFRWEGLFKMSKGQGGMSKQVSQAS
jgi:hypothetical protein